MHRIIKRLHFCYGHRLMDYSGKCARLHGHNAVVELELEGPLDLRGMVHDFTRVKRQLESFLDQIDHRMLLRSDDPLVEVLQTMDAPPFVMEENPTAENIAGLIFLNARELGLPVVAVRLWETANSCAEYREP